MPDLYRVNGRYAGVNPIVMGALVIGVAIYPYSGFTGFTGFIVAAVFCIE